MTWKIEQGLFSTDFIDHHAILGVPVDAEIKDIRKRYLGIARRLHPDSRSSDDGVDHQRAAEYLSKLVNPAYEKLSQEKNYSEYCVVLRLKGQQALKQQDTVVLTSDIARRIASSSNVESDYKMALRELAEQQYQQLDKTIDTIGQISELNLVYLMRQASQSAPASRRATESTPNPATPRPASAPANSAPAAPAAPSIDALIAASLRRAQEFETKQNFPRAILELRDALKMDPNSSVCHSRLGVIYLKTNQATMAKIHFNKALELNPQDAVALEGKRRLEGPSAKPAPGKPDNKGGKPNPKGNQPDKGGGGLFGLFGNKKK